MAKPRIYFLVNSLEWWGAERVITNISSKLREKFEIDIITLKSGKFYEIPKWVNHISLLPYTSNVTLFVFFPLLYFRFLKVLKRWQYKNGISFLEIANFLHILCQKDAIISFRTNIGVFTWMIGIFYKYLIRKLYPKAKKIIVNSEENRHEIAEYLAIPKDTIITIYNPIDTETIEIQKSENLSPKLLKQIWWKQVFITVSRLVSDDAIGSKNHSLVLSIIKKLVAKWQINIMYLIVGDWPARKSLEEQVIHDQIQDYVTFIGKERNVFKYLAHSDYVIYASRHEWFPNVLIEALAAGIPIITSNFKTGAHEVMLGEYEPNHTYQYPLICPNGVILDINQFEEQFLEISKDLSLVKTEQKWLSHYLQSSKEFENILLN